MASNYPRNRDLVILDDDGNEKVLYPTTNGDGVKIDRSLNTNGDKNTSAIPEEATDLQELINLFGPSAFHKKITADDLSNLLTASTDVDEEGKIPDATITADHETRLKEAEKNIEDLLYEEIAINTFTNNVLTAELGSAVVAVTLSYVLNKIPVSATLDGDPVTVSSKSGTITLSNLDITSTKSWNLIARDDRNAVASKTTIINFYNGIYYGVGSIPTAYNSAFISGLSNKTLTNSRSMTISMNVGSDQYGFFALPSRLGTPNFNVGGFDGGFIKVSTISFTNSSGYQENYDIWRSSNPNLSSIRIVVS